VGATVSLPAVIRVAYAKAKVGFVFSRRGVVMEACSCYFLPRLVGHSRALHLATTGETYPADHKLFEPLFTEICPTPDATLTRALDLADTLAQKTSIVSTKIMRELIYRCPPNVEEAHLLDSQMIYGLYGRKDNLEGVNAFLQKRRTNFTGQVPQDAPDGYPWWKQIDIGEKPLEYSQEKAKL
jgi:enoyl-CoA hydratase/carnithine racemase